MILAILLKGKERPVGSISPNGKMKKVSNGKWVVVPGSRAKASFESKVVSVHKYIIGHTKNKFETSVALDADGREILSKDGESSSVNFTPEEIKKLKNARLLIHNHPHNRTFSPTDLMFGFKNGIKEMHVITSKALYSYKFDYLKIYSQRTTLENMEDWMSYTGRLKYMELWEKIGLGKIDKESADDEFCDSQLQSFMELYGGKYEVTKTKKSA